MSLTKKQVKTIIECVIYILTAIAGWFTGSAFIPLLF